MQRILQPLILVLMLLTVAGCISGRSETPSYTSPSTGQTTYFKTPIESCTDSCNADNSRCMDTQAASTPVVGTAPGMFGAAGQCRRDLSSCLSSCKTR